MVKRKYPSELNTTLIRVYKEDSSALRQLSEHRDITIAEVVHQIMRKAEKLEPKEEE